MSFFEFAITRVVLLVAFGVPARVDFSGLTSAPPRHKSKAATVTAAAVSLATVDPSTS